MSHRHFTEPSLLIASGNSGKVREIKDLLEPFAVDVRSAAEFNLQEPEETGNTFIENAQLKARYYGSNTGLPALADDSGLAVDILDGAPGIYSARWAGEGKDFSVAFKRLQEELSQKQGSNGTIKAHFVCALALWWPDGHMETFEGKVFGRLTFPPRGNNGFGYDPIFIANGKNLTFGEMPKDQKHAISHRADAFNQFVGACFLT